MNQPFDPINEAIIQGNFGEEPDHSATIDLTPEDVLECSTAPVSERRPRSKVLPVVAASMVILMGVGGAAYYVMQTAEPEPLSLASISSEAALPITVPKSPFDAAPDATTPAALSAVPADAPVATATVAANESAASPAPAMEAASTASSLPADLAALAAGAPPAAVQAAPSAPQPMAASPAAPAPVVAAPPDVKLPVVEKPAKVAAAQPAPKPTPKLVAKAGPAPAKEMKEAPRKIVTAPVEHAPTNEAASDAVKPLVVMTAQQIGLKALTRDGLVVASVAGTEPKTYRMGSVLPSGERIEMLDAASMVIVTDRNVIRIKP